MCIRDSIKRSVMGDVISLFATVCVIITDPIAGSLLVLLLGLKTLIARWWKLGVFMVVSALLGAGLLIRDLPAVSLLRDGIGEFGGIFGHSIFVLLLALMGMALCWSSIDKMRALTTIGLVALSFPVPGLRPVALVLVVIYSAHGVSIILGRRWEIALLGHATRMLLLCLGLFLVITNVRVLVSSQPDPGLVGAMGLLASQRAPGAVLTSDEYAGLTWYLTRRVAFGPEPEIADAATLARAVPWLVEHDIRYILVTPEMTEGEPWRHEDEGLLYMIRRNEKFINIADGNYELWLFLREYAE